MTTTPESLHKAFELHRAGQLTGVPRGGLVCVGIGVGANQDAVLNALAPNPFHHLANDTERADDARPSLRLRPRLRAWAATQEHNGQPQNRERAPHPSLPATVYQ